MSVMNKFDCNSKLYSWYLLVRVVDIVIFIFVIEYWCKFQFLDKEENQDPDIPDRSYGDYYCKVSMILLMIMKISFICVFFNLKVLIMFCSEQFLFFSLYI